MNMIDWYKKVVFKNYTNFNGRARRSEYWYFFLCNLIIALILYLPVLYFTGSNMIFGNELSTLFWLFYFIYMIYSLLILIPSLAAIVRRLHDTGKSGWYILIGFIPIIGSIILLVWLLGDSQPGTNQWGPNPKNPATEISEIGKY